MRREEDRLANRSVVYCGSNSLIAHIYLYGGIHPPYPLGAVFNKYLLIPLRSIRKYSSQTALKIGILVK